MSNWIPITEDILRATGYGDIVDAARRTPVGDVDPIAQAIVGATRRVRRAVSTGNALDADPTKVPASLQEQTAILALAALCILITLPMEQDLRDAVKDARDELKRITEIKIKVEVADTRESTPTVLATGRAVEAVNVPPRLAGRERTCGL